MFTLNRKHCNSMQDLRFSQQSCWTSSSWSPDGQRSLWPKHYMAAWSWIYRNHDPSKCLELSTQWHSIISQKTWLFNALQFQWAGTSRMNLKSVSCMHQTFSSVTQAPPTECALCSNVSSWPGARHSISRTVRMAAGEGGELTKITKYWGREVKAQTPCNGVQCPKGNEFLYA